jgi:hypothetical protein
LWKKTGKMKRIVLLLLTIVSFKLLFIQCKKNPFDYRNKFLGNYSFVVHAWYWNYPVIGQHLDTTYFYNNGTVSLGAYENTIIINYLENRHVETKIYEDGTIEDVNHYNPIVGEFESKTILKFNYRDGGLGSGGYFEISGNKVKK